MEPQLVLLGNKATQEKTILDLTVYSYTLCFSNGCFKHREIVSLLLQELLKEFIQCLKCIKYNEIIIFILRLVTLLKEMLF